MAVLLAGIAIMGIVWTMVVPVWKQSVQREKEAELVFRGQQYVRAIRLFQMKTGSGVPQSPLEATKRFVIDEFIAMRLAFGGFRSFGATNSCGYFGGANIADEPVPYRTLKDRT